MIQECLSRSCTFCLGSSPKRHQPTWLQVSTAQKCREANAPREPATTGSWWINSCLPGPLGSIPLLPAIQPLPQHLGSDLDGQCLGYFPSFPAPLSCFLGSPKTHTTYTQGFVSVWTLGVPTWTRAREEITKLVWITRWPGKSRVVLTYILSKTLGQRRSNQTEDAVGGEAGGGEASSRPVMRCWLEGGQDSPRPEHPCRTLLLLLLSRFSRVRLRATP